MWNRDQEQGSKSISLHWATTTSWTKSTEPHRRTRRGSTLAVLSLSEQDPLSPRDLTPCSWMPISTEESLQTYSNKTYCIAKEQGAKKLVCEAFWKAQREILINTSNNYLAITGKLNTRIQRALWTQKACFQSSLSSKRVAGTVSWDSPAHNAA